MKTQPTQQHPQPTTAPAWTPGPFSTFHAASGIRSPGFFQSSYDGSWWKEYADDRPAKFYGHVSNLPRAILARLHGEGGGV